jgi:hypothetical protein
VDKDRLVVLAMHAPLKSDLTTSGAFNTQDRRRLLRLLAGRRHLYAVAGHTHTTEHYYFGEEDGFPGPEPLHQHVLATASGSWWSGPLDERGIAVAEQPDGTPNGYHVLEVEGVAVKARYKAAGMPANRQMRLALEVTRPGEDSSGSRLRNAIDSRPTFDRTAATSVYVNLFDGGPRSQAELTIAGHPPTPMKRVRRRDPGVQAWFEGHGKTLKPWVTARPSSHLFVTDLPDHLGPGRHTLVVRATDDFGRTHRSDGVLEILDTGTGFTGRIETPAP